MRLALPKGLLLLSAWLISSLVTAQTAPAFQWAVHTPGVSCQVMTQAPNGDMYAVSGGYYTGAALVRADRAGNVVRALLSGRAVVSAVQTDAAHNLYALAQFTDTAYVGTTRFVANPRYMDYLVCKWDSSETLQWVRQGVIRPDSAGSVGYGNFLDIDTHGNVTIVGSTSFALTFGSTTLPPVPASRTALFGVQFSPTGAIRWMRQSTGQAQTTYARSMFTDPTTGDVILSLFHFGTAFNWGSRLVSAACSDCNSTWMRLDGATGDLLAEHPLFNSQTGTKVAAAEGGYSYLADIIMSRRITTVNIGSATVAIPAAFVGNQSVGIVARLDPMGEPQ